MLAFTWYLIKVLLCSGILFGYYCVALRNKKFHHYNRFYLLISVAISWIIPLLKFDVVSRSSDQPQVVKLLSVITIGKNYVESTAKSNNTTTDWNLIAMLAFATISLVLLTRLLIGLFRIKLLINASIKQKLEDIYLVFSNAKGTPFSFFKYIFWNENIRLDSPDGQHILKHELAHVKENHSADKLFINLCLIAGWFNPFLWLIKKEISMIHEFIADEKAIKDGDTAAFASMILNTAYTPYQFSIANPFFYSPIKRRLLMLTSSKSTRFVYIRKVAILPLLSLTVFFLAFTLKNNHQPNNLQLKKKYTVVIDAGHGGNDGGARGINNSIEKDIALQLAKMVKSLNNNENIEVILTRETDHTVAKEQRLQVAENSNADLLISLHINANPPQLTSTVPKDKRGAEVYVSKNSIYNMDNKLLGSFVAKNMEAIFGTPAELKTRNNKMYVLDENNFCPAVMVECGFITNEQDMFILQSKDKQIEIGNGLLKSIEQYFYQKENSPEVATSSNEEMGKSNVEEKKGTVNNREDTLTEQINRVEMVKENGKDIIRIIYKNGNKVVMDQSKMVVIVNGEKTSWKKHMESIKVFLAENEILSEQWVVKKNLLKQYGEENSDGIFLMTSRKKATQLNDTSLKPRFDKIFTRAENPPTFIRGEMAFAGYIQDNMKYPKEAIENKTEGRVIIKFIVDEQGNLSDFESLTSKGYGLENEAIRLIKNSGPWKPATQNGRKVAFEVLQQIHFKHPQKSTNGFIESLPKSNLLMKMNKGDGC